MVMLRIYLARHGQDEDNANGLLNGQRDTPLTDVGVAQAKQLAYEIEMRAMTFDKVYASPLKRAYATAQYICTQLDLPAPEVMDELKERNFGVLTGEPYGRIAELSANVLKTETVTYFLDPEGAETFPVLLERAEKILAHVREKHQKGNILLVSHGDIGKMIYAAFYKLDWMEVLKQFHFGNSELLLLAEDSPAEQAHVFQFAQHNL